MKKNEFAALEREVLEARLRPLGFSQKAVSGTSEKSWVRAFEGGFEALTLAVASYAPALVVTPFFSQRHDAVLALVAPHLGFVSEVYQRTATSLVVWPRQLGEASLDERTVSSAEEASGLLEELAALCETRGEPFLRGTRTLDGLVAAYRARAGTAGPHWPPTHDMMALAAAHLTRAPEYELWRRALELRLSGAPSLNEIERAQVSGLLSALDGPAGAGFRDHRGVTPGDVLSFWFGDTVATTAAEFGPKMRRWYQGGPEMDAEITARFGGAVEDAIAGNLGSWSSHPKGWLAELLVLDQFTRNVLRDSARMYLGDERAQAIALEAFDSRKAYALNVEERNFTLMPLVHAENLALQDRGVTEMRLLVEAAPEALRPILAMGFEQTNKYRDIIARFGRFPHRNELLGRTSTPDEIAFLRDWEAKKKPAGADDRPPVKKG